MKITVTRLVPDALLPMRSHPTDAGTDLFAAKGAIIPAQGRALVGTGVAVALPPGYVGLIWGRSGLALRHGVTVLAGVMDASYRGEWQVLLLNTGSTPFTVSAGDRIAQALIQRVELCTWCEVDHLPPGSRGQGGFGSTGV